MLSYEQLGLLRDIETAIAFDGDRQGMADWLVIEGFAKKVGDLYELTPAGEKAILDNGILFAPA